MNQTLIHLSGAALLAVLPAIAFSQTPSAETLPIADAHVHYSHDSVERTPPERVIELMREANLKFALVSSSDDAGTQLLRDLAPDLIVPGLRPYTRRGQSGTWYTDEDILAYVEDLITTHRYATIGEFHLFGDTADLPIPRRIVQLADEHNLILHAHSDAEAVERLLAQSPTVKVIWAHSGFEDADGVSLMLAKHDRLWADLAFRSDVGSGGELDDDWRTLVTNFPDRIMLGTDTYTPERIYYIPSHAESAREWLAGLPTELAEGIAWKNAFDLIMPVWQVNRQTQQQIADVACENDNAQFRLEQDGLSVLIEPQQDIRVSEPFAASVTVCGTSASRAEVELDATMPAHGHGMNYSPTHTVTAQNETHQQLMVDDVVLHMPGFWQWSIDVVIDGERTRLKQDFTVQ